ncbi:tetraacyldisaccharide 4'-kinase [Neisseriaceae bacterium B1]
MKLHTLIEQHWQQPKWWLRILLKPFSCVFGYIAQRRRQRYLSGSLKAQKLPVPVVVIGNIHAGGTGKTPITAALVKGLQQRGIRVGIISRGYGRTSQDIHVLTANSTAAEAGDEPLMLYRQTGAPIAVGAQRVQAGLALLARYPELQLLIADDGLQHYALARDWEVCVFPAHDVARSDLDVLPNGGLREAVARLYDVDVIVVSNARADSDVQSLEQFVKPVFRSQVRVGTPYRLARPAEKLFSGSLKAGETCVAVAAVARPERFFNSLRQLGFGLTQTSALPDHAVLHVHDLPQADYVLITEKDAVKLPESVPDNVWVLPIEVEIEPDLVAMMVERLNLL